jgi:hypothetical protein
MIKITFGILILAVLGLACRKDKFNTKPSLSFKSVNAKTFFATQDIKMLLNATDKEGDLTDTIFIFKRSRNCNVLNTYKIKLPVFPTSNNLNIDVAVNFTYGFNGNYFNLNPNCSPKNDSCSFKFVLKDKAGNVSDTITSPEIVLIK